MKATLTPIPGLLLLDPKVFWDARGFFLESYNERVMADLGIRERFVQDNQSFSTRNVLRGLHYQLCPPQGKLVRVVSGKIFDVAVDLRRSSPSFGQWHGATLSGENKLMFWIPPGFAHGSVKNCRTSNCAQSSHPFTGVNVDHQQPGIAILKKDRTIQHREHNCRGWSSHNSLSRLRFRAPSAMPG